MTPARAHAAGRASPPLPGVFLGRSLAHRALHGPGIPENSRAAVSAAVARGYGIEIDLQLSADGVAMVFHDSGLERLTGASGYVRDRSAAELGQIGLTGGAEGIPTLAEILALVAGRVPLLVEIKDRTGDLGASDGRLEAAASAVARGYAGPLAFMSFNPSSVAALGVSAPQVARGLVGSAFRAAEYPGVPADRRAALARLDVAAVGAGFVSQQWTDLGVPRVAELAQAGCPILCWTVRSPAEDAQARQVAQNVTFEGYLPDDETAPVP